MCQLSDDELAGIVEEAVVPDRDVPQEWRDAARAAYTWRTIDHELMALTHDSCSDEVGAVRREDDGRTMAFTGGGLTLEIEVSEGRILGQLATGLDGEVTFEFVDIDTHTSLCVMAGCDVNVIANSTFSWWAAYLNPQAEVYAPSRWFGPAMPPPNDRQDDILHPSWRQIPVTWG